MQQQMQTVQLTVPPGYSAGQELQFRTEAGAVMSVPVPVGVPPGQSFVLQIPCEAPGPEVIPMGIVIESNVVTPTSVPPALRYAECPICYEPLHKAPVGVFLSQSGARVSNHFYQLSAARSWIGAGNGLCPLTRKPIASVLAVPDLRTDPDAWFDCCDVDGDGRLSRAEVVECLKAQFPMDVAALDAAIADRHHWMWEQWDVDGSGWLEREELLAPNGLVAMARELFAASPANGRIPNIRDSKEAWYSYWDEDNSGTLEQEEVVRALLKTLELTLDEAKVLQMRSTITAIWPIFDTDGSGSIERDEFLRPGEGLADTILATMDFQ
jgi:Ca2+-binding EF-hand superfamily protein